MDRARLLFLGTGASEGIPDAFCRCPLCEQARLEGGLRVRTRSAFRLDERVQIDLGPDSNWQAVRCGVDFYNLEHVLYTHTHDDHLSMDPLYLRRMAEVRGEQPLNLYLVGEAYGILDCWKRYEQVLGSDEVITELLDRDLVRIHPLAYHQWYDIGTYRVLAMRGSHRGMVEPNAANYLIQLPDGRTLYYGCDTGVYPEETFAALAHCHVDILISECTFGNAQGRPTDGGGHLDVASCERVLQRLLNQGTLTEHSTVYLTHLNHHHSFVAEDFEAYFQKHFAGCPVICAYDGLQIGGEWTP